MKVDTRIEILDASLNLITWIKSPMPFDTTGTILQYSKELSDFGQCKFRVSAYDSIYSQYGDILQPHVNHIRITRNGTVVWAGAIIENTKRTKDYVEVLACEYLWYLNKIMVIRSGTDPGGTGPTLVPTGYSASGNIVTLTFGQTVTYPLSAGQQLGLTGFTPSSLNGSWIIVSFTSNTVAIDVPSAPGSASGLGTVTFSDDVYRIFTSGGMDAAVESIINETITTYKGTTGVHPLANMTLGEIDNPNYPPNLTNAEATPQVLSGPWMFGNGITAPELVFDFHSVLYVLKSFGAYTYADFNIDENLAFNFRSFLGYNRSATLTFKWGKHGNAYDFNIPRLGQQMVNDLIGICTDPDGVIQQVEKTDEASITTAGILQDVAAYTDVKDLATLTARVVAELPLVSNPNLSPITVTLEESAYPLGVYDIGDIATVIVEHDSLTFNAVKRIVGISVVVNSTGRELTTVQMNNPLPSQLAGETVAA